MELCGFPAGETSNLMAVSKPCQQNHRATQGSIPALLRAAEPAQLLQQVPCGWAVKPLYKHVLERACSLQGSFQLHFGAVSVVRYQLN